MARPHFSSSGQKAAEAGSDFDCLVCRKVHSKETHDTIRMVILSDSLLFKAYLDEKPEMHIDCEILNGATVRELSSIFTEKYLIGEDNRPFEVILVAGINDIMKGRHPADIMADISNLKSQLKNHNKLSLLSVATLPLSPKLCSLYVSSNKANSFYDLSPENNKIDNIEAVNSAIIAINRGLHFIKMSKIGVKGTGIGKKGLKKMHIDERGPGQNKYFIEDGIKKGKLHFTYVWRYFFFKEACTYLRRGLERG